MSKSTHAQSIDKITGDLRAELDRIQPLADAEAKVGAIAAHRLIVAAREALAELAKLRMEVLLGDLASLPPVCGGGHDDDWEEMNPEFEACPDSWLDDFHPALDGYVYETGPTPDYVLEQDLEALSDERDWEAYFDLRSQEIREEDLAAAGLAIG